MPVDHNTIFDEIERMNAAREQNTDAAPLGEDEVTSETFMAASGRSRQQAGKILRDLEKAGKLTMEKRYVRGHKQKMLVYRLKRE